MPGPESLPIDKIYVPVKRKKALKPELIQEIAESIMEIGNKAPFSFGPIRQVRLIEGLHRSKPVRLLEKKPSSECRSGLKSINRGRVFSDGAEQQHSAIKWHG